MSDFYAWAATGVVARYERWTDADPGENFENKTEAGAVRIASRVVDRQRFVIRQRDNLQIEINLINANIEFRNGQVATAVWAASRDNRDGQCVFIENHTTGASLRLIENVKQVRQRVGVWRIARFGLLSTIPAALAMLAWLLVPGTLETLNLPAVFIVASLVLIVLFVVGAIGSKLIFDYLRADDDQKLWSTVDKVLVTARRNL